MDNKSIDLQDQINHRIEKAKGICGIARASCDTNGDIPANSLASAMWAVEVMLDEVAELNTKLYALVPRDRNTETAHG